jgi:hypothetical protein
MSAVEWVFRHAGGCLIDTPDLPVPRTGVGWRWAATLWTDPYTLGGWTRLLWVPGERGWQLPATLAIGDVLEFGITHHDHRGRPNPRCTWCWFGWFDHATDYALIVHGPYDHPTHAVDAAQPVVDELRLRQLDPPVEALVELGRP